MNLEFSHDPLAVQEADALLVGRFKDGPLPDALQDALGDAAADLLADSKGKVGDEVAVFYPRGLIAAKRLLLVGLGDEAKLTVEGLRRAAAKGIAKAKALGATTVATTLAQHHGAGFGAAEAAQAVVEAAEMTLYHYSLKQKREEGPEVERLRLVGADEAALRAAAVGKAIGAGVAVARDLLNAPPNIANASFLATTAQRIAESSPHIRLTTLSLDEAREMGMGAFAGVAQGSASPAHVIILEYRVEELKEQRPIGMVGKGLTFDTGGISIKPAQDLWKMKYDLGGGAAVLGTFQALAALPEPLGVPVVGIVPATDNAIGSAAFTPADVLTALNGKTIEVQNTDAEGRLIMADALTYMDRYHPRAVIDIATLTGAIIIALGRNLTGLFSNNEELAQRLERAAAQSGEEVWRMPLHEDYEKLIESTIADVKNTAGRYAGAIGAALFLQHFIGDYPWAHLDIAGPVAGEERTPKLPYNPKGASGVGVRLLFEWLVGYARETE